MGSESDVNRDPTAESGGPEAKIEDISAFDSMDALGDEIVRLAADLEVSRERYPELVDDYEQLGASTPVTAEP